MIPVAIMRVAGSQCGLFSRAQWIAAGLDADGLQWRVDHGQLTWEGPGVYGLPGWPESWLRDAWRQHLLAGPHSVASLEAAASIHSLWPFPRFGKIEFSVPHGDHDYPTAGRSHQPRDLQPHHIVVVEGLRVTSVARTLCDLAVLRRRERLARAIEQADIDGKCPIAETVAMYEELRKPGKPGFKMLGQILRCRRDDFEIPGGHLERLFRGLLRKYDLAEPTWQAPLPWNESRRADGIWYPQKALLELDSRTWHGRIDQITADRQRDREARRHGFEPYRFTYEEVKYTPAKVAAEVRAILDTTGVNRPVWDRSIDSRARETG